MQVEARHGKKVENNYQNDHACASFIYFIALKQLEILPSKVNFFSIHADASANAANKECELFMVQYLDSKSTDGQLHVRDIFLAMRYLDSGTDEGLYNATMLCYVGMQNLVEHKLVRFGCDHNCQHCRWGVKGAFSAKISFNPRDVVLIA